MEAIMTLMLVALCISSGQAQQLDSTDQQLDMLTSYLVSLNNKLDALEEAKLNSDYGARLMMRQLDDLQGLQGGCKKNFFPCSAGPEGAVQCVRNYLVCDGSADCKNGADETPDRCQNFLFKEKVSIPGFGLRDDCKTMGNGVPVHADRTLGWFFNGSEILPWFPSRPKVPFILQLPRASTVVKDEVLVIGYGIFYFASGDLMWEWEPTHFLMGICTVQEVSPKKTRVGCHLDPSPYFLESARDSCWLCAHVVAPLTVT